MNKSKKISRSVLASLLYSLICSPLLCFGNITVTVDRSTSTNTSAFYSGFSQIDNTICFPWSGNNGAAVTNARVLSSQGVSFINNPIVAWGASDIWSDPTNHSTNNINWGALDTQMAVITNIGCIPMLTLCDAPWWMKGSLAANGTTTYLIPSAAGEWGTNSYPGVFTDFRGLKYTNYMSPDPYNCRIIDGQMTNWITLVKAIADRYMVAPYNVRYFQVWNEMKGYWDVHANDWDKNTSAGTTSGYNCKHGYTYMYNQVYAALTNRALAHGIALSNLFVGGPYAPMASSLNGDGITKSTLSNAWGMVDQRDMNVISYWLTNKIGGQFICFDGSNINSDGQGGQDTNYFARGDKFADINNWVRQQAGGGATLPIVWSEWYNYLPDGSDDDYNNAVCTYDAIQQIESGASLTLLWGGGPATAKQPLWSSTGSAGGGQATPWYYSYQALDQIFGNGTALYPATSSSTNIAVLASLKQTLFVNETTSSQTVNIDGTNIVLGSHEVAIEDAPPYIKNPHMADGDGNGKVADWNKMFTYLGSPVFLQASNICYDYPGALAIKSSNGQECHAAYGQSFAVNPNIMFTVSGYVCCTADTATIHRIYLKQLDGSNNQVAWQQLCSIPQSSNYSWSNFTASVTITNTAVNGELYLEYDGSGEAWLDDVSCTYP